MFDFDEKVAEFNAKWDEFQRVLAAVTATDPKDAELAQEKTELIGRAHLIESMIQKAKDAINWANMQMGQLSDTMQGNLGVLPAVAIAAAVAAVAGAIAYMSSWISDAYAWSKKAEIARTVVDAGGSPADVQKAIEDANGGLGSLTTVALLAAVGGLVWWSQNRG